MVKNKYKAKIFLVFSLFLVCVMNVAANTNVIVNIEAGLIYTYGPENGAEEFCENYLSHYDRNVTKVSGRTLEEIQEILDVKLKAYTTCRSNTTGALNTSSNQCAYEYVDGKEDTSIEYEKISLDDLYRTCPLSAEDNESLANKCRVCINYTPGGDVSLPETTNLCAPGTTCDAWVKNNNCKSPTPVKTLDECLKRCVCEEDIETCKRNCEYNFSDKNEEIEDDEQAEDNTSDLDFSEKDGCAALGGLTAIIRDIYKMIRVFLSIFLVIITMLDYAKVIMDNDDFKSFKKAHKHFAVRIGIIIVLFLLPELINFLLNAIGLGEYFCW